MRLRPMAVACMLFSQVKDVTLLSIVGNGAWVLGLAVLLANASVRYDEAQRSQDSFLQRLEMGGSVAVTWLGLFLVAVGLAATSSTRWELVIWVIVALYSLTAAVRKWRNLTRLG